MKNTHSIPAVDVQRTRAFLESQLRKEQLATRVAILTTGRPACRSGREEPCLALVETDGDLAKTLAIVLDGWRSATKCSCCAPDEAAGLSSTDFLVVRVRDGAALEFVWSTKRKTVDQLSLEFGGIHGLRSSLRDSDGRLSWTVECDDSTAATGKLSGLLDEILNEAIPLGLRPVAAANLHAIVPLEFKPIPAGGKKLQAHERARAADELYNRVRHAALLAASVATPGSYELSPDDTKTAHYFLPHVHKLLAPGREAIRQLVQENRTGDKGRRCDTDLDEHLATIEFSPANWSIRAQRLDGGAALESRLSRIRLHFYTARTLAVEWLMEARSCIPEPPFGDKGALPLWRRVLDHPDVPTVAAWMDGSEILRMIYSAFASEPSEPEKRAVVTLKDGDAQTGATELWFRQDGIERPNRQPIRGICAQLLRHALGPAIVHARSEAGEVSFQIPDVLEDWFELRTDDRARIVHALVPSGREPKSAAGKSELEAVQARLRTAERYGASHFYENKFSRTELKRGSYDRFRNVGSRYLVSDHCFAFMGFEQFSVDAIARSHMPDIYRRMVLLQAMNAAVLNGIEREIAEALEGWTPDAEHDETDELVRLAYERLEPRFAKFVNVNWFERVSSQMQGGELFDLIRRESGLQNEFALVSEEIRRTDRYLARIAEQAQTEALRRTERDRQWLIALGTLAAGIVGGTKVLSDLSAPSVASLVDWAATRIGLPARSALPPLVEWKFELVALGSALLLAWLLGTGVMKAPGANARMRPSVALVVVAFVATFALPLALLRLGDPPVGTSEGVRGALILALAGVVATFWWSSRPLPVGLKGNLSLRTIGEARRILRACSERLWGVGDTADLLIAEEEKAVLRPGEIHDLRSLRRAWLLFAGAAATFVCIAGAHAADLGRIAEVVRILKSLAD